MAPKKKNKDKDVDPVVDTAEDVAPVTPEPAAPKVVKAQKLNLLTYLDVTGEHDKYHIAYVNSKCGNRTFTKEIWDGIFADPFNYNYKEL